jgi:hypothetical protein
VTPPIRKKAASRRLTRKRAASRSVPVMWLATTLAGACAAGHVKIDPPPPQLTFHDRVAQFRRLAGPYELKKYTLTCYYPDLTCDRSEPDLGEIVRQ